MKCFSVVLFVIVLMMVVLASLAGSALATPIVIDDLDSDYTNTGTWNHSTSDIFAPKFDGDISYSESTGATATWSFGGLDDGIYTVYAIWLQHSAATTAAEYAISDSSSELLSKTVNQNTDAPAHDLQIMDGESDDEWFEELGNVTITDGTLKVVLSNANDTGHSTDGHIFADAIAITIPEPATMSLLGLGGLLTLVRRRRK